MNMSPSAPHPDTGGHACLVLVVEDQVLVRTAIAEFLRDRNYKVIEAANAAEALAIFHSGMFIEIMFSDLEMPGEMDGLMLARWVREHHREVHVLLTSGRAPSLEELAPDWSFFLKPYSFDQVADRIDVLCQQRAGSPRS